MGASVLEAKPITRKQALKRVHRDRLRPLRVLEYLDNSAVFEKCPVEVKEGYIVSDRDNGDLFLVLIFRCLSGKPMEALDIRVHLYNERQPVPFSRTDFRYSWETATLGERALNGQPRKEKECKRERALVHGEEFGQGIFLPLPGSYFHKMQIELVGVAYTVGEYEPLGLIAGGSAKRFAEIDSNLRSSYVQMNIFQKAEEDHPIRVLPQAGENAWLCCCGHKNPASVPLCEACGRDKDWQLENLSVEKLQQVRKEQDADQNVRVLHDTSAYAQNRYMESDEEKQRKVQQCNEVLERLAAQEKAKEHRRNMVLPKILLLIGIAFAIWLICELVFSGVNLGLFGGE
ncbi:MAG: hypothetical protein J1E00_03345 [Oscillospiraceae bacterium]|nr:hypothetical protein [Oscillospiraceae bacterium]